MCRVGEVKYQQTQSKRDAKCISHLVRAVKWGQITPIGYLSDLSVFTRQNTLTCHSGRGCQNNCYSNRNRLVGPSAKTHTTLCECRWCWTCTLISFLTGPSRWRDIFPVLLCKAVKLGFFNYAEKIEIYEALKGCHRLLYRVCCYPCNIIFSSLVSMNLISTNQCS